MNFSKAAKVRAGFEEQQLKWFAKSICCKPFDVTQLGFCCTIKKQNHPYRGLQVELGLRSTRFAQKLEEKTKETKKWMTKERDEDEDEDELLKGR